MIQRRLQGILTPLCLAVAASLIAPSAHAGVQVSSTIQNLRVNIVNNKGVATTLPVTSTTGNAAWGLELGVAYGFLPDSGLAVRKADAFGALPSTIGTSASTDFAKVTAAATATTQGLNFSGQFSTNAATPQPSLGSDSGDVSMTADLFPHAFWGPYASGDSSALFAIPVHGGLWLPAHSTATISGTLGLDASATVDDLLVDPARVTLTATAATVVSVFQVIDGGTLGDPDTGEPLNQQGQALDWSNHAIHDGGDTDLTPINDRQSFEFVVHNTSNQGNWLILGGVMSVNVSQLIWPDNAPIPEPGTWALMMLGLAGIGLASRRQAQRARI